MKRSPSKKILGRVAICAILALSFWVLIKASYPIATEDLENRKLATRVEEIGATGVGHHGSSSPNHFSNVIENGRDATILTPEKARKLLDGASAMHPSVGERAMYCAGIIKDLCKAGYSREAWNLIEKGNGMLRRSELSQFFASAELDDDSLVSMILEYPNDLHVSASGFLRRFDPQGILQVANSGTLERLQEAGLQDGGLSGALAISLKWAMGKPMGSDPRETLEVASKLHSSGRLDTRAFFDLLNYRVVGSPIEKWQMYREVSSDIPDTREVAKYRDAMLVNMVRDNAEESVNLLANEPELDRNALRSAMTSWIKEDSGTVSDWYQRVGSSFSRETIDIIAESHTLMAIQHGEYETAKIWISEINDEKLKSELNQKLGIGDE